ncbi:MAG: cobalamin biosynthesis protein CobD, partial [Methylococcales bacterium]|nr:cobalamin biosynthesis protein CobD [Methylococcales bacterium]
MLSIVIAVLLDLYFGEPKKGHPLIVFGKFASKLEQICFIESLSPFLQRIIGVLVVVLIMILFLLPLYFCQQIVFFNWVVAPVILYFCIAANSLKQHGKAVFEALHQNDLALARKMVARIVSRDCQKMDEVSVRRASLESVLENGADAVFAPIFWFLIGGAMGAVLYRLSNTLDAMWGYKNKRYLYFGWAAARLDDVLNFIPARLTACSYLLLGNTALGWHCWRTQAAFLDSPNAGVVMTAGAGCLNLQLGGVAVYEGIEKHKPLFGGKKLPENQDLQRVNQLLDRTLLFWGGVLL